MQTTTTITAQETGPQPGCDGVTDVPLTAPTVVAVLVRAIERDAWRPVEADGALDVLVGGGLDAIALLARSLPLVIGGALGVAVVRPGRLR